MRIEIWLEKYDTNFYIDLPARLIKGDLLYIADFLTEEIESSVNEEVLSYLYAEILYCTSIIWGKDAKGDVYQRAYVSEDKEDIDND